MKQSAVRIAVSGHRQLEQLRSIDRAIKTAGDQFMERFPRRQFLVYSCLAEGSDQLLAKRLIEALPAQLIAVLPLPEEEYFKDFVHARSLKEFQRLRSLAVEVINLEGGLMRPGAYQAANEYLIEHCDALAVIWDGLPARGEGGTGDMVALARQAGRGLLWIHTGAGSGSGLVTEERLTNDDRR